MPTQQKHEEQVMRNKQILALDDFDSSSTQFGDWVVTIAFYTAVHLIERELAKIPYDSKHHDDREASMWACGGKLKKIFHDYKTLKAASLRTRYHCCLFSAQDTKIYLNCLDTIENTLGKVS